MQFLWLALVGAQYDSKCVSEICDVSSCHSCSKTTSCLQGCKGFKIGLVHDEGCLGVCNVTAHHAVYDSTLNCVSGCRRAAKRWISQVIEEGILASAQPPTLRKKFSNKVILSFEDTKYLKKFQKVAPFLPIKIEWEANSGDGWHQAQASRTHEGFWLISDLIAYTKYKFRALFNFSPSFDAISTNSSLVIKTLSGGVPTQPNIIDIKQVSVGKFYIMKEGGVCIKVR